uniref:Protein DETOXIFICATION n=1 Tax=Kalanchoe fedtschenkoi TaxID=63787 RepID=A0A7N0VDK2_KALFE
MAAATAAASISRQFLTIHGSSVNPHARSISPNASPLRLRLVTRSAASDKSIGGSLPESPSPDLKPVASPFSSQSEGASPDRNPVSGLTFYKVLRRIGDVLRFDELGLEILSIALPAALALAADPITSLVDTAFVGHLGSAELAAVGVSASVFNLVSKLFNVPLLNVTTSFVAEEQAVDSKASDDHEHRSQGDEQEKKALPSISTSLILAASIGVAQAVALFFGSGFLMNVMGIPVDSPMRIPAEQFLAIRALGAPPIVVALAAQGTFRGLKDLKTPLYAISAGNLLNAVLDPVLIFLIHLGISGAAIATVISEYLIAAILLWKLNQKVQLVSPNMDNLRVGQYLKSGGLLIGRTLAVVITMTIATSMAAREGPIQMAGHQICFQVWLAVSLLTDALAIAGQTLLATNYSLGDYEQSKHVIYEVLKSGYDIVCGIWITIHLVHYRFRSVENCRVWYSVCCWISANQRSCFCC